MLTFLREMYEKCPENLFRVRCDSL